MMGCTLFGVIIAGLWTAVSSTNPAPVRWAGLGLAVLGLILGTILDLAGKL